MKDWKPYTETTNGIDVVWAFCIAPKSFKDFIIPEEIQEQVYGTYDPSMTIVDFSLIARDVANTDTFVFLLSASYDMGGQSRSRTTTDVDVGQWDQLITQLLGEQVYLTLAEYKELEVE